MATNEQDLDHLLQGLQRTEPRLYEVLSRLVNDVSSMKRDLEPLVQVSKIKTVGFVDIAIPIDISVGFTKTTIHLSWSAGDPSSRFYEIRVGTEWDFAQFLTITPTTDIHLTPIAGSTINFLIKAIDIDNNRSRETASVVATPQIPGPPTLNVEVIDNFVFIRWNVPNATFDIKQYEIFKGAETLGFREGTFTSFFEQLAGDYAYGIVAIDIAGNRGARSNLTVHVNPPPDYVLTADHVSDFDGSKDKVKVYEDPNIQTI